ncbi:hypothetical protein EMCRGX_G011610 [Ephydatia muelleri]
MFNDKVSGEEPSALIQNEVLVLNDEERRALLQKAGISSTIAIGAAEVLIKAGLVIPWNKLRLLRRWLKSSGISLAGEERMREISKQIVGDNLKGELAPFSFMLPSGGEEIKGAPVIYIPELVAKIVHLLEENESEMMATPLSVRGHAAQRTLETMRADHQRYVSAGSIKRDAQKFYNCISPPIFDIPVSQVCPPGLHITLGIFTKMFNLLEAVCCNLDLELALHATDVDSSSFSKYSLELQNLPLLQAELEEAQQAQEHFQQMWSWLVVQREIHEL